MTDAVVDRFELLAIEIPAGGPFRIRAATFTGTLYLVCRLGMGPLLGTGYAFVFDRGDGESMLPLLHRLVESEVLGRPDNSPRDAYPRLLAHLAFTGLGGIGTTLIGAIDMALWDLAAQRLNTDLPGMLGVGARPALHAYVTCGSLDATPEVVAAEVGAARAAGYWGVKIKVGGDPDHDEARVRAARQAAGPGLMLLVDVNQSWDLKLARRLLDRWVPYDLYWVEEPIDAFDFDGIRLLRESTTTRIAVGETYYTPEPFKRLLRDRVVDVLTINPQKIGGVTPFLDTAFAAGTFGVAVTCHTFPEVAAQLLAPIRGPEAVEIVPWMLGAFARSPRIVNGSLEPNPGPGLGLEPSPAAIAEHVVARVSGP